jgi:serralysin
MIEQISGAAAGASSDTFSASGALPYRLEDSVGGTYKGKPIFDLQGVIGQIDSGRMIAGKTITFGFMDGPTTIGLYNNPKFEAAEPGGYSPLSEAQKEVARQAMQLWDDLIPQNIVEKNGNGADILFANTTTGPAQAWAYYPGNGHKYQSDVWTATPEANWTNNWLGYNGYGRLTLVHEAGHALGLGHPGEYNYSDDDDNNGEPDPITYEADAFYAQDTMQFSIMSYFSPTKTGAQPVDGSVGLIGYAQTPLLHDIYVIQSKYGADPTTRAGDTVYGFNSNAGNAVYDFSQNTSPFLSIYDAGGNDTLDLSGANAGVFLDLRPGSFSSAAVRPTLAQANAATEAFNAVSDEAQGDFALWTQTSFDAWMTRLATIGNSRVTADTGVSGVGALSHRNISIAYNTVIENAIGGAARDYLVGNHVGNKLIGNGGNDVLNGLGGNDTLTGGSGADEFRFTDLTGADLITDFASGVDKINLRELDADPATAAREAFAINDTGAMGTVKLVTADGVTTASFFVDDKAGADFVVKINGGAGAGDFLL